MKYEVSFEIISLNEITNKIVSDIKSNPNIFACGIDLMNKLMSMELPLLNKNIAVKNILSFLRYIDNRLKHQNGTTLPIDSKILIEYFNRNEYKKYLALLKDLEVLVEVPYDGGIITNSGKKYSFYCMEKKICKQYRIFNQYLDQNSCLILFNKSKTKIKYNIQGDYNKKFVTTIKKIDIDIKAAIEDEIKNSDNRKNNSLRCRLNRIFSLYDKRFIRKGKKVDRVYTSLSNLSKISRRHLNMKGVRFHNVDIKNCQPLLLCYLLIKNNMPIDLHYLNDCESGVLYENFYERSNDKAVDKQKRSDAKVLLYKGIYFDFKRTPTNLKFKELFPLTYSSLEILSKDQEELAGRLQNIEAQIFNDLVPIKSKYYYTLFDAIYFTDIDDTANLFIELKKRFAQYGIIPSIDINSDYPEMDLKELIHE